MVILLKLANIIKDEICKCLVSKKIKLFINNLEIKMKNILQDFYH